MRVWFLGLAGLVVLAGCSVAPPAAEIREKDDPFSPSKQMATGFVRVPSGAATVGLQVVGEVDRVTGIAKAVARVQLLYVDGRSRHYEVARNDRAEQLPLAVQATKGRCGIGGQCPHEEIVAITLPIADLRRVSAEGYRFKLFPKFGPDVLVSIPREMVANIVASMDNTSKRKG